MREFLCRYPVMLRVTVEPVAVALRRSIVRQRLSVRRIAPSVAHRLELALRSEGLRGVRKTSVRVVKTHALFLFFFFYIYFYIFACVHIFTRM